jgi:uncharacterized iron-regulated membrane protein
MTPIWKFFRTLHLGISVVFALFAAAVGVSGSALVFREEIEHVVYEPRIAPGSSTVPLDTLFQAAAAVEPARRVSMFVLPERGDRTVEFILQEPGARTLKEADQMSVYVNPYTRSSRAPPDSPSTGTSPSPSCSCRRPASPYG